MGENKLTEAWRESAEPRRRLTQFIERVDKKLTEARDIDVAIGNFHTLFKGIKSKKEVTKILMTPRYGIYNMVLGSSGILFQSVGDTRGNASRPGRSIFINLIKEHGAEIADHIEHGQKRHDVPEAMWSLLKGSNNPKTEMLKKMHKHIQTYLVVNGYEQESATSISVFTEDRGESAARAIIDCDLAVHLKYRYNDMTCNTVPSTIDGYLITEQLYDEYWKLLTGAEKYYDKIVENNRKVLDSLKEEFAPYLIANEI